MNKWIQILTGLVLLVAVIIIAGFNIWSFGSAALVVLKGGVIWMFALLGLLFLLIGINELRE